MVRYLNHFSYSDFSYFTIIQKLLYLKTFILILIFNFQQLLKILFSTKYIETEFWPCVIKI